MEKPKFIKDLGMYTKQGTKQITRWGLYECPFCNKEFEGRTYAINMGRIKSCGCVHFAKTVKEEAGFPLLIKELGMRFPTLKSKHKARYGLFQCPFCPNTFEAHIQSVKHKKTLSCGCLKHNPRRQLKTTVGHKKTKVYEKYTSMIGRCYSSNKDVTKNHGQKGITVCDEWRHDFLAFKTWALANGFDPKLEINRINNDGNYEPSNCNFIPHGPNNQNTRLLRKTNKTGFRGVSYDKARKKYVSSIDNDGENHKLGAFDNKIEAAIAYNNYVIEHGTFHPLNPIPPIG